MRFLFLATATFLSAAPAFAFLTNSEQLTFLKTLTRTNDDARIEYRSVACNQRNRLCIVKVDVEGRPYACAIELLMDVSDLMSDENTIAPYTRDTLKTCLRDLR